MLRAEAFSHCHLNFIHAPMLPEMILEQLYASLLGNNFSDYSNFRARLLKLGFLSETGVKTSRGAGRPASLYRFDVKAFVLVKDKPLMFI